MVSVTSVKQKTLIQILKHDAKDKRYKPKDFEHFEKIKEQIDKHQVKNKCQI